MGESVKDTSLAFIVNIDEELKIIQKLYESLNTTTSPGMFLEKLPEYKEMINRLDSKLSIDKHGLIYLTFAYRTHIESKKARFFQLKDMIRQRTNSPNQLNTNFTFYDEENQLSKKNYAGFEEDPSMYSMISIVKRIMNAEQDYLYYFEQFINNMDEMHRMYANAQGFMLTIKSTLEDQSFVTKFTSEYLSASAESELLRLQREFKNMMNTIGKAKTWITDLFRMYNAQERDYQIYEKVVEKFESVVLESHFSKGFVSSGVY